MFTTDVLKLAHSGQLNIKFFTVARQLKIDQAKFSPGQVNIKFFHCCLTAKIYIGKLTQEIAYAYYIRSMV